MLTYRKAAGILAGADKANIGKALLKTIRHFTGIQQCSARIESKFDPAISAFFNFAAELLPGYHQSID